MITVRGKVSSTLQSVDVGSIALRPLADPLPVSTPVARRKRTVWRRFLLLVVLPTLLVGLYEGVFAADRYTSDAHFSLIRGGIAGGLNAGALGLEGSASVAAGGNDSFAVRDYLTSRDAMRLLIDRADLRAAVRRGGHDPLWRFPSLLQDSSDEQLYLFFRDMLSVQYDPTTGLTTLSVQAFRAADAQHIVEVLLDGSEALVNQLNRRAREDAVRLAEEDVTASRSGALKVEDRLTEFRKRWMLLDPRASSQVVLKTISELTLHLVDASALLDVTQRSQPQSPQIAPLQSRIRALRQQIDEERQRLAGSGNSFAPLLAEYERLDLLRDFAARRYISALTVLEAVRIDAEKQQVYIARVSNPQRPDAPLQPQRLLSTLIALACGLMVFWMFGRRRV